MLFIGLGLVITSGISYALAARLGPANSKSISTTYPVAPSLSNDERSKIADKPLGSSQLDVTSLVAHDVTIQGNFYVGNDSTFGGSLAAKSFIGSGTQLTGVNAALLNGRPGSYYEGLASGITALQSNAALLGVANTFTANNNFNAGITVNGAANLAGSLTVGTVLTANTLTPTSSLTVGATARQFILQGNASSTITATGGGFTTALGFSGSPTGAVTYNFDRSPAAGTYSICTTTCNCVGLGGGVTTGGGTVGTLPVFTAASGIGDSLISQSGATVTANGNLNITTGNNFEINGVQISSANLSNGTNLAKLNASQTFTGNSNIFMNATNSTSAFQIQNATGTPQLAVDTTNSQVNIGTLKVTGHGSFGGNAAPSSFNILALDETVNPSTNNNYYGIINILRLAPTATSANFHAGIFGEAIVNPGNSQNFTGGLRGGTFFVEHNGTGTVAQAWAGDLEVHNLSTGTITDARGLYVASASNSGGGAITNNYGVKVDDQTAGSTNYAIFTGRGAVQLGDATTIQTASATAFQVKTAGGLSVVTAGTTSAGSLSVTAQAAPTGDIVAISNSGQADITGVSGLHTTYAGGNAAVEGSGIRIDFTPGGTSGGTWDGLRIVASGVPAAGVNSFGIKLEGNNTAHSGTETAIDITTGWDIGIAISKGGLQLNGQNDPGAPSTAATQAQASGAVKLYAQSIDGRMFIRALGPSDSSYPLQTALFAHEICWIAGTQSNVDTKAGVCNNNPQKITAAGAGPTEATGTLSWFLSDKTTSNEAAVAGDQSDAQLYLRGSTTGESGFFYKSRIYLPDTTNSYTGASGGVGNTRFFTGLANNSMTSSTGPLHADAVAQPRAGFMYSTTTNAGAGDPAIMFSTDNGTTENYVSTGMAFTGQHLYDFYIYTPKQGTTIYWRVDDLTAGTSQSGSVTGSLPGGSATLRVAAGITNTAVVTTGHQIGIGSIYSESGGFN